MSLSYFFKQRTKDRLFAKLDLVSMGNDAKWINIRNNK